ncbi:MAG: hypothetical protein GY694_18265 [Gammaproteobacteria bacterium]|nr:hypothetical protein [Gammaproteobacteria bacterium]
MKFTWLNKQGVESSEGFIVQCVGRFESEYREKGKVMTIGYEHGVGGGKSLLLLKKAAFRRWDNDTTLLSNSEQDRIYNNFKKAIEFQGMGID